MSHFQGSIEGKSRRIHRQGTRESGMNARIRGEKIGVMVNVFFNEKTGQEVIRVSRVEKTGEAGELLAEYAE